jgi:pimeloyl-ACP methyl ester carboxylesterase
MCRGSAGSLVPIRTLLLALVFCLAAAGAQAGPPIHEARFVKIGGIEQWVTIDGRDRDNPVVLLLHGGPGDAMSPFAASLFGGWDKDFTLVQWDQRGAGRTFGKSGPSVEATMTIARMRDDGIELAQYLARHLGKRKITLLGGSWGSILGIHMVHARPELFYAYVGTAQLVNWEQNLAASYARVLEMARAESNKEALAALTQVGAPPWGALAKYRPFRKWQQHYQAKIATAPEPAIRIDPAYASPQERAQWDAADEFNWLHFVGLKMSGPLAPVDLPALGLDFALPIFIVQGEQDLTARPQLAKAYFDSIKAPRKQFVVAPGTGHEPSIVSLNLMHKLLAEQVRPMALAR